MVQRLTYKRRHCYNTKSNAVKIIKTPGGKLTFQYTEKKRRVPRCGDCGMKLIGIPAVSPQIIRTLKKRQRKVSRAYGGSRCHECVKARIVRAFLKEEKKLVKKVAAQAAGAKKK
uniref:60S ribosomal protein L34 n=1 Tax=Gymnochlora stellata TaxID=67809 RepID=B5A4M6_GYMST|nr:60S ribosomal protein L34 [Gymnochlora stellata]